jgi:hypothetical protein
MIFARRRENSPFEIIANRVFFFKITTLSAQSADYNAC